MFQIQHPLFPATPTKLYIGKNATVGTFVRAHRGILESASYSFDVEFWKPRKGHTMAKNKGFNIQFVNVRLTEAEKVVFNDWYAENQDDLLLLVDQIISTDNKFTISYSTEYLAYTTAVTCKDLHSVNVNWCITSRSDDMLQAIGMSVYKTLWLYADKTWADLTQQSNWG